MQINNVATKAPERKNIPSFSPQMRDITIGGNHEIKMMAIIGPRYFVFL